MTLSPDFKGPHYIGAEAEGEPPRLREKYRQVLRGRGCPAEQVERYVEWCKDFVVFGQRRRPEEMGALEVEQYLQHVRQERGRAVEEARSALTALYRDVLGRAEALEPRLLERVRALLRVRHYALRTEECYVQWIRRYILFHDKRHPLEMGGRELQEYLTHLAVVDHVSPPVGHRRTYVAPLLRCTASRGAAVFLPCPCVPWRASC